MVRSMREWWEDPTRALRQMVRRLEVQNSILLGYDVFHHLQPGGLAVAWSTDFDIYFNSLKLPQPESPEDIVFVTGVNNHELAHIKYTPKLSDVAAIAPGGRNHPMYEKMRTDRTYQHMMNLLEDQRIETLMVKRYASQRPYFVAAFTRIVLAETDHLDTAYLLARGRRYLPVKIRRALKRKFKVQEAIPDIRRIIDAYRKLNLYRSAGLHCAHELIEEMIALINQHNLWSQDDAEQPHNDCLSIQISAKGLRGGGSSATDEAVQEVSGLIAGMDASDAENDADDGSDGPESPSGHQGTGDIDAEDVEGDSGSTGKGDGAGAGTGTTPTDSEVERELKEATRSVVEASTDVAREVAEVRVFIRTQPDINAPKVSSERKINEEMPGIARRISNELRKLEADTDPYWEQAQNSGRLNAKLAMRNGRDPNVFNRWQEGGAGGQEQEWVVLLDTSGSMDGHISDLARAAWVMKRASDIMRAKMTVLAYGSEPFQVVYAPNETVPTDRMRIPPGLVGTVPGACLLQAHAILGQSSAPQRGLLVMTDGDWSLSVPRREFRNADEVIEDMNGMGVLTHLVHYGSAGRNGVNKHSCRGYSMIGDLDTLPGIMRELIKAQMRLVQK